MASPNEDVPHVRREGRATSRPRSEKTTTRDPSGGRQAHHDVRNVEGDPAYLTDAIKDIGIQEWVLRNGERHSNPVVERYIEKVAGKRMDACETAWCAFFVGAKLEYHGIACTKSGMARSYLKWGTAVELEDAQRGDIVVLMRGKHDDGVLGHVGFLIDRNDREVVLLGGNQGDSVSVEAFDAGRVLGVRRPRSVIASRTVKSAAGAGVTEATKAAVDAGLPNPAEVQGHVDVARDALSPLAHAKPWIMAALTVLTFVCIGYTMWYRYQDHRNGKNT